MKFVTLSAVAALVAGSAHAGGMTQAPVEPLVMAPSVAPVMSASDWTGGYAGVSLGYGSVDAEGSDVLEDGDEDGLASVIDSDGDGVIGGVYAGYQYDFGRFVVGAEADLNAANLDFDDDDFFGGDVDFDNDGTEDDGGASIDQIHRLKLRAGYDAGNALIYGVGGLAYAEGSIDGIGDVEDTGFLLGAGVDYKVTESVSVGGEVLYHQFDDFDDTNTDFDVTTVQARVSYNF